MKNSNSLNEELNRIKKLMNFKIEENSHDSLSNRIFKEQTDKTEKCKTIKHVGEFAKKENIGSNSFVNIINKIKNELENYDENSKKGLYLKNIKVIGGASNHYNGKSVIPELNNDRKTKYNKATTYDKDENSREFKYNKQLAIDRAKNVVDQLTKEGGPLEKLGIKVNQKDVEEVKNNIKGFIIDTGGENDDERDDSKYNAGQIVSISMDICSKIKATTSTEEPKKPEDPTGEDESEEPKKPEDPTDEDESEEETNENTDKVTEKCFENVEIQVIYDDTIKKKHYCNNAIYEIYANGLKLIRETGQDYASLNNKGIMDDGENIGGRYRKNVFKLTVDGENQKFFNKRIYGKHKGKLVITAACKKTKKPDGGFLRSWKIYPNKRYDCHDGVGKIIVKVPSLKKQEEKLVRTPNIFDKIVKLAVFPVCNKLKKYKKEVNKGDDNKSGKDYEGEYLDYENPQNTTNI